MLDTNTYQRGIKITDKEMEAFEARHVQRHEFHGNWNYVIKAAPDQETTRPNQQNSFLRALSLSFNLPALSM